MDPYHLGLLTVTLIPLGLCAVVAISVRGITFFGLETDNWKMVRAAATLRLRSWPSRMHQHGFGRAQCREYWVIGLALIQRLLGDRKSDYPNVLLALVAHGVSTVFLFLVASHYWSIPVGFVVAVMYVSSCWPYQVALYVGHVLLSQAVFLLAILMTQLAASVPAMRGPWDVLAGLLVTVSFFSSSSSRKYPPVFFGAFLYSHRGALRWPHHLSLAWLSSVGRDARAGYATVVLLLVALILIGVNLMQACVRPCARWLHAHKKHPRLSWFAQQPRADELGWYEHVMRKIVRFMTKPLLATALYLLVTLPFTASPSFYLSHLLAAGGALCVFGHVMLPNLFENARRFSVFFDNSTWISHFNAYGEFFAKRGKPIQHNMRGAGLQWVYRFFIHMVPFQVVLYGGSLIYMLGSLIMGGLQPASVARAAGLILLSLSPILVGELTRGLQGGKSYFPGFLGLLVLIAHATYQIDQRLIGQELRMWFWLALGLGLFVNAVWNAWVFVDDVWPARMGPALLAKTLRQLGVTRFSTYQTPYNDAFVNALSPQELDRYEIQYIKTLAEAGDGYVVVPGTSAKAVNMETQAWAIQHGDFNEDPLLSRLIESREIKRYAAASFKTFGTSRVFVHESEVTSYRSLILKDISERDRWRGRAWLLDGARLRECLPQAGQELQWVAAVGTGGATSPTGDADKTQGLA